MEQKHSQAPVQQRSDQTALASGFEGEEAPAKMPPTLQLKATALESQAPLQRSPDQNGDIPWKDMQHKHLTLERETGAYSILRQCGWPSNSRTDTLIMDHLKSKYLGDKMVQKPDGYYFKQGVEIWVPLYSSYLEHAGQTGGPVGPQTGGNQQAGGQNQTAPSSAGNYTVAGVASSQRIMRVAWTFDDGPTQFTDDMEGNFAGIPQTTWFVERKMIKPSDYPRMAQVQRNGGEIALHGVHPSAEHRSFFPVPSGSNYNGGYDRIADTVESIRAFKAELAQHAIRTKFIRLPGGLFSELVNYARKLGIPKSQQASIAREVIANPGKKRYDSGERIRQDLKFLLDSLSSMGLHLWQGNAEGAETGTQSWDAETAGVKSGRGADNTTRHQAPARRNAGVQEYLMGRFESKVDKFGNKDVASDSLLILAHDTTSADVREVGQDKRTMENYANSKNVRIEYHTVSGLYESIRGVKP